MNHKRVDRAPWPTIQVAFGILFFVSALTLLQGKADAFECGSETSFTAALAGLSAAINTSATSANLIRQRETYLVRTLDQLAAAQKTDNFCTNVSTSPAMTEDIIRDGTFKIAVGDGVEALVAPDFMFLASRTKDTTCADFLNKAAVAYTLDSYAGLTVVTPEAPYGLTNDEQTVVASEIRLVNSIAQKYGITLPADDALDSEKAARSDLQAASVTVSSGCGTYIKGTSTPRFSKLVASIFD